MTELSVCPTQASPEPEHERWGQRLSRSYGVDAEAETLKLLSSSLDKLAPTIDARAIDHAGHMPESALRALREAGLFALTIPEDCGGLGLSLKAACPVIERLAQLDRSLAVSVGLHCGLGTQGIVRYAHEDQRQELLPLLASGEWIGAFATTEAGAGSDLMAISTTGLPAPGGLRVSGQKCYVTNGALANCYTVLVRTPEHGGSRAQTLVCIPRDAAGVSVGQEEDKLGLRGSSTATLYLEDVFVPERQILGLAGSGARYAASLLSCGRTLMAAGCIGTAREALRATLAHVAQRRQFGRSLSQFLLVQEACADMAASIYAMESLLRLASDGAWDQGQRQFLSTLAKVHCSESTFQICDRAIQLHGALGFLEPTGLPLLLRDCRITRIFEGANDVLLLHAGTRALASDWEDALPLAAAAVDPNAKGMQHVRRALEGVLSARGAALRGVRKRHGVRIVERQTILAALGRSEVYQLAAYASLVRGAREVDPALSAIAERAALHLIDEAEQALAAALDPGAAARDEQARQITEQLLQPLSTARSTAAQDARS